MPKILTPSHQSEYLKSEHYQNSELDLLIDRAETVVVNKYRDHHNDSPVFFDSFADAAAGVVELRGWAETSDGTPDPSQMDDRLLDALRESIARIVEHWIEKEGYVQSESVGSKSFTYRDAPEVPSSALAPLRPFDHSEPVSGFW